MSETPIKRKPGRPKGTTENKTQVSPRQIKTKYRSFYEVFAAQFPDAQKAVETPEGLIEILDSEGRVVWRQLTPQHIVDAAKARGVSVGQALKENQLSKANQHILSAYKNHIGLPKDAHVEWDDPAFRQYLSSVVKDGVYPYDEEVAHKIADRFAAGERLVDFLGQPPYPNHSGYMRWKARYKEFFNLMEEARKMRADRFVGELEYVTDTVSEHNSKSARVKSENLRHLAAVNDPDRYGNRTKIVGDKNSPIAFHVVTGIKDAEDIEKEKALADASEQDGSE